MFSFNVKALILEKEYLFVFISNVGSENDSFNGMGIKKGLFEKMISFVMVLMDE